MDISEHNLIPFSELEKALEKQQYGSVSVFFEVYQGKVVAIQGNQTQTLKFKEDNTKAISVVLNEIKTIHENKSSGNFTFTIKFDKGDINKLFLYRNLTKNYPLNK
jgi:hypothetical protein